MHFWAGNGTKILNTLLFIFRPCITDFVFSCQKNSKSPFLDKIFPEFYADFRSGMIFRKKWTGKKVRPNKLYFCRDSISLLSFFAVHFLDVPTGLKLALNSGYFGIHCDIFLENTHRRVYYIFLHEIRSTTNENNKKHILYFGPRIPLPIQNCMNDLQF
jgi:hypothetical protein